MTDLKETQYEAEVIEDARTGEIIPVAESPRTQSNTLATSLDLTKVGTFEIDEKADAVLGEPIKDTDVQIRPDGLVYLPWTWFADRLNRAFGRLGWGLIPQAGPQSRDMGNMVLVVWGHWLVVKGVPVGFEVGECAYRPDNHTMSFGDAAAGAKSNSLARNCKMLGMSLELFNQEWVENWKKQYAERVKNPKGSRPEYVWQKKTSGNNHQQQQPEQKVTEPAKTEEVKAEQEATEEPKFKVSQLRTLDMVKKIASQSKQTNNRVAEVINSLDSKISYSISDVVKLLRLGE